MFFFRKHLKSFPYKIIEVKEIQKALQLVENTNTVRVKLPSQQIEGNAFTGNKLVNVYFKKP